MSQTKLCVRRIWSPVVKWQDRVRFDPRVVTTGESSKIVTVNSADCAFTEIMMIIIKTETQRETETDR